MEGRGKTREESPPSPREKGSGMTFSTAFYWQSGKGRTTIKFKNDNSS
jgi:hypothetical protein